MKRLVLVLAACGGGQPAPTHPAPPPAQEQPEPATTDHPTPHQCDALLDHAVALSDGSTKLTEEERAKVRAQLHDELASSCSEMTQEQYTCFMAANTKDDLDVCE